MSTVEETIRGQLLGGRLPCAKAFAIGTEHGVSPKVVCETADGIDIRICRCQLGLFGYEDLGTRRLVRPLSKVAESLEDRIRQASGDGRISCAATWRIAEEEGLPRFLVGCACETLDVRVSPCQLGCF